MFIGPYIGNFFMGDLLQHFNFFTFFQQYCVLYWNLSTTEAMHKEYDIDVPQQVAA
jgi:hypothetical protein